MRNGGTLPRRRFVRLRGGKIEFGFGLLMASFLQARAAQAAEVEAPANPNPEASADQQALEALQPKIDAVETLTPAELKALLDAATLAQLGLDPKLFHKLVDTDLKEAIHQLETAFRKKLALAASQKEAKVADVDVHAAAVAAKVDAEDGSDGEAPADLVAGMSLLWLIGGVAALGGLVMAVAGGGDDDDSDDNDDDDDGPVANRAPVAANDTATTNEDTPVTFNVRANDTDADGNSLTVTQINGAAINATTPVAVTGGSVSLGANGSLTFTPTANYNGAPSFTYTVSDGNGGTATGTVNLTVTSVNDAPANTVPTAALALSQETSVAVAGLSIADADAGAALTTTLTVASGTLAAGAVAGGATIGGSGSGTLTLTGTMAQINATLGAVTYTGANDFFGDTSLTITTTDGQATDTDTVAIAIARVFGGVVQDGYVSGATVFIDVNGNGKLDAGEPSGTTDATGNFSIASNLPGNIVAFGGTNIDTGLANTVTLTAPVGSTVINPITTLVAAAVAQGQTAEQATESVNAALGLPPGTDLTHFDILSDDADPVVAVAAQKVAVQIVTILQSASAAAEGADDAAAQASIATQLGELAVAGTVIDLGNIDTVTTLLTAVPGVDEAAVEQAAVETAAVNQTIAAAETLEEIVVTQVAVTNPTYNFAAATTTDIVGTNEEAAVNFDVRANDVDPEGNPLSVTHINGAAINTTTPVTVTGGVVTIGANGHLTFTPNLNFNGAPSFNYTVSDGTNSSTGIVKLTVTNVNDIPVAANDAPTTNEDTPITFDVRSNDSDVDADALSVTQINGTAISTTSPVAITGGTVSLGADGRLTFSPTANYNGTPSFNYTLSDGKGGTTTATVNLTVTAVNDAPIVANDARTAAEDTPVTFDVRTNDSDVEGGALAVTHINGTAINTTTPVAVTGGSVSLGTDGLLTFTPAANYNGTPSFTYTVTDGTGSTNGTVNMTVTAVNDVPSAANDVRTTSEDTPITFDVRANDSDVDADALTVTHINGAAISTTAPVAITGGTVSLGANGHLTFTPTSNFNGTPSFAYTLSDGKGGITTATVNLTVNAVNDAPIVANDAVTTAEDTPATFDVRTNDSDVEGSALAVTHINGAAINTTTPVAVTGGSVSLGTDGLLTFTPAANYNGTPSFTYTVTDGTGSTNGTVNMTVTAVNDTPVAATDVVTTNEDTPITFDVRSNDSDIDADALSVTQINGTAISTASPVAITGGTVSLGADGRLTFSPSSNYNGTPSFNYTLSDGKGGTTTATVNLTVTAVNDAPIVANDARTTAEDTPVTFDVRTNDSDVDGGTLSVTHINGTAINTTSPVAVTGGSVSLGADGLLTFTPAANYNGTPSFTYTVSDGTGSTNGTVNMTVTAVNDIPVAANDVVTTNEDTPITFDVRTNDSDVDDNALSVTHVNGAAISTTTPVAVTGGTVSLGADGRLTFSPTANYNGTPSFTYTVTDGAGGSTNGTVNMTVAALNDAPAATNDAVTTDEGAPVTFDVRTNDSDVDANTLSVTHINGIAISTTTPVGVTGGSVSLGVDGRLTFSPSAQYNGTPSFTYTVADGAGGSSTGTVNMTVTAVNDAPVAIFDVQPTNEDTAVTFDVRTNDRDVDGDALSVTHINETAISTTSPVSITGGSISLGNDGLLTFTPNANYSGTPSFTYTIADGHGGTATATVNLTVAPVNDAPLVTNDAVATAEDTPVTFDVRTNDGDVEGSVLSVTHINGTAISTTAPVTIAGGSVSLGADGRLTFTPAANYSGTPSFAYTVSDGAGGSANGTVNVTVIAVSDAPVAANDAIATNIETPVTFDVRVNDSDGDGDVLTVTHINGTAIDAETQVAVTGGIVTMAANGQLTFTPEPEFLGVVSFDYTISDGRGGTSTATVNLTVAMNAAPPEQIGDTVYGHDLNDEIDLASYPTALNASGDIGDDTITGNGLANLLQGGEGEDTLDGQAGNDNLDGGSGHDDLIGGAGNDLLFGGEGEDSLLGGADSDTMVGGADNDFLDGGTGNNDVALFQLDPMDGNLRLVQGTGPDSGKIIVERVDGETVEVLFKISITGTNAIVESLNSASHLGTDFVTNYDQLRFEIDGNPAVLIYGGPGNETFSGGLADDVLSGGAGHDYIFGDQGNDSVYGDAGNDLVAGAGGDDYVDGGAGYDLTGYYHTNAAWGGVTVSLALQGQWQNTVLAGNDFLVNIEAVSGTPFADHITGDEGGNWLFGQNSIAAHPGLNNDTLIGGGGNDLLSMGVGNHVLDGGTGNDTADFSDHSHIGGITVSLQQQGAAQNTGAGNWTITNVENLGGASGNDTLTGDANNNILAGSGGSDTLTGGDGNDTLLGDGTFDMDYSGAGYSGPMIVINSGQGSGNDFLNGGAGDDVMYGGDGNDNFTGGTGNDTIYGGTGDDYMVGDEGNDTIDGGDGNDVVAFRLPADTTGTLRVVQGTGADEGKLIVQLVNGQTVEQIARVTLSGAGATVEGLNSMAHLGTDTVSNFDALHFYVSGFTNPNQLAEIHPEVLGTAGNDNINGGNGTDAVYGGDGSDIIFGNGGNDFIYGQGGNDSNLRGGAGDDLVSGGDGHDYVFGAAGNDHVYGDAGNDLVIGFDGDDYVDGGDGFDWTRYDHLFPELGGLTVSLAIVGPQNTGFGMDTLVSIEAVSGTPFADNITGDDGDNWLWGWNSNSAFAGANNDIINGGGGNDLISMGVGNHTLDGGTGNDTADFSEHSHVGGIVVSLEAQGSAQNTNAGSWTITNVENLGGASGDDILTGDGNDNIIAGHQGDDTLSGGGGNDTLLGDGTFDLDNDGFYAGPLEIIHFGAGTGNDILDGGAGNDHIVGGALNDTIIGGEGYDTAYFLLPDHIEGEYRIVPGTGADFGKLVVQRVDGNIVENVFLVSTANGVTTVQGLNSASFLGTDTVTGTEQLMFGTDGGSGGNHTGVTIASFDEAQAALFIDEGMQFAVSDMVTVEAAGTHLDTSLKGLQSLNVDAVALSSGITDIIVDAGDGGLGGLSAGSLPQFDVAQSDSAFDITLNTDAGVLDPSLDLSALAIDLALAGIDHIGVSGNGALSLSNVQAAGLAGANMDFADGADITLTMAEIQSIDVAVAAAVNADHIDMTSNVASISDAEASLLVAEGIDFAASDFVTVEAAGTHLSTSLQGLKSLGVDAVDAAADINVLTLDSGDLSDLTSLGLPQFDTAQGDDDLEVTLRVDAAALADLERLASAMRDAGIDHFALAEPMDSFDEETLDRMEAITIASGIDFVFGVEGIPDTGTGGGESEFTAVQQIYKELLATFEASENAQPGDTEITDGTANALMEAGMLRAFLSDNLVLDASASGDKLLTSLKEIAELGFDAVRVADEETVYVSFGADAATAVDVMELFSNLDLYSANGGLFPDAANVALVVDAQTADALTMVEGAFEKLADMGIDELDILLADGASSAVTSSVMEVKLIGQDDDLYDYLHNH